ncbi:MAG: endolytic transglycosylase MltG [Bryobacteraceae bacterium]
MTEKRGALHRFLRLIAIAVAISGLVGGALASYWYFGPYRGFQTEAFVEIERGMSSRQIARELADQGVVRSRWAFAAIRALHPSATLQAGEYRFGSAQTPSQVFEKIRRGEIFYEDFTVPEGSNIFDIASLLEQSDMVDPDEFLKAAASPESIRDFDPVAPTLEGYLFPSTYRLTHKTTAKQLCDRMTREFRKQWALLAGNGMGLETHKIVTLASLIEKETAITQERPLVAAVFANRLRLSMPLQCDPTTVYAALLDKRYRGVIHKSDLASQNPYNTYAHTGLPPGPIANPGIASLKAALHPAGMDYLYFVAKSDGSGSHQFSAKLIEHEKAVLVYRKNAH